MVYRILQLVLLLFLSKFDIFLCCQESPDIFIQFLFQPSQDVEEVEEQMIKEEIRQLGQWKKSGQV